MEQPTVAGRINWNQKEVEQVANRYLELRRENPKMGEGAALKEAQKLLLEERQRGNLCGLSQVPRAGQRRHEAADHRVCPAPEDKNAYMPIFLLAGGDRQDFQRLQAQMMNASIRLQKIDVSKPQHISVPAHDRTVLWTAKLTTDLQHNIRGKVNPAKLLVHAGTFDELGPVIVREAQKVRDAMK